MSLISLRYAVEWNTALTHAALIEMNEQSQRTTTIDTEDQYRAENPDGEYY